MILASELAAILAELKLAKVSAFRYKCGKEEIEVAVTPELVDTEVKDYSSNRVGFDLVKFDGDA